MRRPVADCSHPWHEVEGGEKRVIRPPLPVVATFYE